MAAPDAKPKRIKSILDYLAQDVPKPAQNAESVPGQAEGTAPKTDDDMTITQPVPMSNNDKPKRKPNPKFFA